MTERPANPSHKARADARAHRRRPPKAGAAATPAESPEAGAGKDSVTAPLDEAHYRAWHLADTPHDGLTTEFEWTVMRFQQAFERWVLELGAVTGMRELSFPENVILHVVSMQNRPKTAAAIARQLNRDDIPNIQYCLRKLEKAGFCRKATDSGGKNVAYETTARGRKVVARYAELRTAILTAQTTSIEQIDARLKDATGLISLLTGLYDEAARVTATYSDLE